MGAKANSPVFPSSPLLSSPEPSPLFGVLVKPSGLMGAVGPRGPDIPPADDEEEGTAKNGA